MAIFSKLPTLCITVLLAFPMVAFADIEVTCFDGDCLTSGWTTTDLRTRQTTITVCVNNDCEYVGWVTEQNGREVIRSDCKAGGCFVSGWTDFESRFNRVLADIQCIRSYLTTDCLTNGWTTNIPGRGQLVTRCLAGDCQNNGWDVYARG